MSTSIKFLSLAVLAAFFVSCTTTKKTSSTPQDQEDMQYVELDTMEVHSDKSDADSLLSYEYKPAKERVWDLLHTALDLSFDWAKEEVIGQATLTLSPIFYAQRSLTLDAINFDVEHIIIDQKLINDYQNTGREIIIPLPRHYQRNEELKVEITYTAHPRPDLIEEGAAISSDQGLFFIDPLDTIPDLPRQLWTQGETTNNSRWFPTLDQPNERGTQEIILTVADTLMTLSNGLLVSSSPLPGGMRRDHWKLDLPHAPYLAMVAVGQWDKVTDYWRGRPVEYYVDPGYGLSARSIFANTPEMIEFFSSKLGYDFVWPKYAQIIVKNFVSGAMENTTAVVFGDFIQFHQEDQIEEGVNDYIVAHELFHHWFGDLVTCESWANLTLNEGFANYAEYLWMEYKYGRERADVSRMNELGGYFDQVAHTAHPLIHFHYGDEEEMFDAHSYNKGGLVLHMLRDIVGDDAFFTSLRLYLQRHAYQAAEVHDLRQAFEEVTGRDMNWFFDQWYFGNGHPILEIHQSYKSAEGELSVEITQSQDEQGFNDVFILPIEIAVIHQDSSVEIQHVLLDKKSQTFRFSVKKEPLAVVIDPRDILLAESKQDIPATEYSIRAISDLSINHRISAMRLMEVIEPPVMEKLLMDSSYTMRAMLVSYLADHQDAERLYELSLRENHAEIQYYILQSLLDADPLKAKTLALRMLEKTDKIPVIYSALLAVAAVDIDEAMHQITHFQNHPSSAIYAAQASIYAKKGNVVSLDFFTSEKAANINDDYLEEYISAMALFLSGESEMIQDQGLTTIDSDFFLRTKYPEYRRFYLITGLVKQYVVEQNVSFQNKILSTIKSIYRKETNTYLRGVLEEGLGDLLD